MLTPCLYCSSQISASAAVCPKCKEDTPLGLECVFCQQRGRRDQVIPLRSSRPTNYSHQVCLKQYFSIPDGFTCPDCHSPLVGKIAPRSLISETPPACPQCGNPSLFTTSDLRCRDCSLPFYGALGQDPVTISEGWYCSYAAHPGGIPSTFGHSFCRSALSLPKPSKPFSRAQTIGLCASIPLAALLGFAVWPVAPTWLRVVLVLGAIPLVTVLVIAIIIGLCWISETISPTDD